MANFNYRNGTKTQFCNWDADHNFSYNFSQKYQITTTSGKGRRPFASLSEAEPLWVEIVSARPLPEVVVDGARVKENGGYRTVRYGTMHRYLVMGRAVVQSDKSGGRAEFVDGSILRWERGISAGDPSFAWYTTRAEIEAQYAAEQEERMGAMRED